MTRTTTLRCGLLLPCVTLWITLPVGHLPKD